MKNKMLWSAVLIFCLMGFNAGVLAGVEQQQAQEVEREKELKRVMERYEYSKWTPDTGRVTAGVSVNRRLLRRVRGLEQVWERDSYTIETVGKTTYTKIRKWWKREKGQLEVTMVVSPSLNAAKEYLIHRYANTELSAGNMDKKVSVRALKMDIGHICFASPVRKGEGYSSIDFIRNNVLFMLRAEGDVRGELGIVARSLEALLLQREAVKSRTLLVERPVVAHFSALKARIKLGESVPLRLEVHNPVGEELRYTWKMTGGGIEKGLTGNYVYYGGEVGKHTVTVTVINDFGLHETRTLQVVVEKKGD